jgi:uncharacterized protein (TIGR02246 family)
MKTNNVGDLLGLSGRRWGLGVAGAAALLGAGLATALVAGGRPARPLDDLSRAATTAEPAIRAVLDAQVAAWNRGDVDGFMDGYARSDATRFASGSTVLRGWDAVRDRYRRRYASREQMGRLTFSELEIDVVAPDAAVVFGRWKLERTGDSPGGLFTLQFALREGAWRIVADHTSAGEEPSSGDAG